MTKHLGWLFITFLLVSQANAKVIRGTITDAASNEPLPAATVQVLGVYDGTISNTEGKYILELSV